MLNNTGDAVDEMILRDTRFIRFVSTTLVIRSPSSQGKCAEAVPLNERATEIWMKALGPEHPTVATALNNRAALLRAQVRATRIFGEMSCYTRVKLQMLNNRAALLSISSSARAFLCS